MNVPPPTRSQARMLWLAATSLAVAVLLGLIVVLFWALIWAADKLTAVLLPVAIALILAYILDPVVEFFVRRKMPRRWAIVLVFLLGLLAAAGILGSVVPGMVRESRKLANDLPQTTRTFQERVGHFIQTPLGRQVAVIWHFNPNSGHSTNRNAAVQLGDTNLTEAGKTATVTNETGAITEKEAVRKGPDEPFLEMVMSGFSKVAPLIPQWFANQLGKLSTWAEFLIGFILVPVYLFYFLLEKKGINRRWTDYLPIQESKAKEEIVFILQSINDCMIVFFRGQVLVQLCVGTLIATSYLILGLNYAVLLGVVAAVLGIVPYIGAIISFLLALTLAAVQFGDWTHPLLVIAIAATVKTLEDFVIGPKIIGERSGLHPLTIIIAVMLGTTLLGGILGAVLAIPLTAVLRTLMFRYVWRRPPAGPAEKSAEE